MVEYLEYLLENYTIFSPAKKSKRNELTRQNTNPLKTYLSFALVKNGLTISVLIE
jgi:hypothetical protein